MVHRVVRRLNNALQKFKSWCSDSSETLVPIYQTTLSYIPEYCNLIINSVNSFLVSVWGLKCPDLGRNRFRKVDQVTGLVLLQVLTLTASFNYPVRFWYRPKI
jgi:hypothetical protein